MSANGSLTYLLERLYLFLACVEVGNNIKYFLVILVAYRLLHVFQFDFFLGLVLVVRRNGLFEGGLIIDFRKYV